MTKFLFTTRKHKKVRNIVKSLSNRQYWNNFHHRESLRILRNLVLADHVYYKKIYEKSSNKPILYEGDRLYMDNHRTCLTINGRRGQPAPLFSLPACSNREKIEDVLICEATLLRRLIPQSRIPLEKRGWRPCMICVTADNHLVRIEFLMTLTFVHRYDLDTGEELERVYLHNKYQFRYLSMEDEAETVIIRSKHMTKEGHNVYKAVCMFTIFPLEFVCMFEVEKKIFGKDIVDCMLYQGLMINKFSNGTLRFHDYNKIRDKYTMFETRLSCHPADKPLPINLRITETPEVLFEIRCYNHDLHVGGSPWQYIQSHGPTHFSVHLMDCDYQLTPGIRLGSDVGGGVESDRAMFHPDDSGRIIHLTTQQITIHKVVMKSCGPVLTNVFTIHAQDPQLIKSSQSVEPVTVTASGRRSRKVKRENVVEHDNEVTLDGLDYEDELELATACHVTQTNTDSFQGRLCFYDNQNGNLLKEMVLEEDWDEFGEHLVVLDRDVILHIVKSMSNKYTVHLYRLSRHLENEETGVQVKTKPKRVRRRINR